MGNNTVHARHEESLSLAGRVEQVLRAARSFGSVDIVGALFDKVSGREGVGLGFRV